MSRDVRVNEASEWDWSKSAEIVPEAGESSAAASIAIPKNSEIADEEDESG